MATAGSTMLFKQKATSRPRPTILREALRAARRLAATVGLPYLLLHVVPMGVGCSAAAPRTGVGESAVPITFITRYYCRAPARFIPFPPLTCP